MRLLVLSSCVIATAVACSDDPASAPAAPIDPPADGGAPDVSSGPDAGPDAAPDAGPDARPAHDAADAAFEAMMLSFWDGGRSYLRSERPQASALTGYWIFAQALDAVLDSSARTGGRYRGLIETFYLAQDAVGWSRDFFDDENWMALALLRAYDLTGRTKYLARAKELFADIMTNADDASCCIASAPGGLWWDRPHTQKATAANAGPVVTAVRLWQRTNDTTYLDFAKRVWAYWDTNMVDEASHRVFDHVKPGGEIVSYRFTYNEGLMIAASVALHEATKDAKVLAEAHAIARADQDAFALRSQQRAAQAIERGRLAREIAPVSVPDGKRGAKLVERDEHPRADTTLEALASLKTPFRSPGTITAGNAAGVNDGAAALIVASEAAMKKYDLTPLARVVGGAVAGVEPRTMGIGPVPATQKLLAAKKVDLASIDVIELNEAFAAQALACLRALGIKDDAEHVNPNGGAIALGHPLGMSGARLAGTAALELHERSAKRALCTMCIGVGQGITVLLERV